MPQRPLKPEQRSCCPGLESKPNDARKFPHKLIKATATKPAAPRVPLAPFQPSPLCQVRQNIAMHLHGNIASMSCGVMACRDTRGSTFSPRVVVVSASVADNQT